MCQNIYRYNRGGQLSETGYRVNKWVASCILMCTTLFRIWLCKEIPYPNALKAVYNKGCHKPYQVSSWEYDSVITDSRAAGRRLFSWRWSGTSFHADYQVQEMALSTICEKTCPDIIFSASGRFISGQEGLDIQKRPMAASIFGRWPPIRMLRGLYNVTVASFTLFAIRQDIRTWSIH